MMNSAELLRSALEGGSDEDIAKLMSNILNHPDPSVRGRTVELFELQNLMNHTPNICGTCSSCCSSDRLLLDSMDVKRISDWTNLLPEEFTVSVAGRHYMKRSSPCLFLKDNKCLIYPVRPNSCVFFPFFSPIQKSSNIEIRLPVYCIGGKLTVQKMKRMKRKLFAGRLVLLHGSMITIENL